MGCRPRARSVLYCHGVLALRDRPVQEGGRMEGLRLAVQKATLGSIALRVNLLAGCCCNWGESGVGGRGREPFNPGAGPGAVPVALPEAFGGNRRLYTAAAPAADRLCPIPVHGCPIPVHGCPILPHPRSTIIVVIYSVFCVWCSKNIVFYRVLWPSPSPGFILATLKNHGFFMVLGLRQGSGTENWTS